MTASEIAEAISYFREQRKLLDDAITALRRISMRDGKDAAGPGLRLCSRCSEMKPLSAFHRNGPYLMSFCRDCNTERCRRYYRRNRQRVNDQRRLRRHNPEIPAA